MRALSLMWLIVLGCNNMEKSKCLEACKVDHHSAAAACEASDDPPGCKQKADTTKADCTKQCDAK